MSSFVLPPAPASERGEVKVWRSAVTIPTYLPDAPDRHPMFLQRRVFQGSSGRVYPLPVIDRVAETRSDVAWDAIHLENAFVRLMLLPQIGGRIHVALDKTNGYDLVYRNEVIKPALVGLAGPWISGGIEFNWPQHHRPRTFLPTDVAVERHDDGSVTVWMGDHDAMHRLKGMHGVCLHPGRSVIELKARLYNRTPMTRTFLWWANVATKVHELYQSFFPPDVHYVADHAKRATSRFPRCDGVYYGVDYGRRGREGVSPQEAPRQFAPRTDLYAPNDLAWYANIPTPCSYMAMGSKQDFFGGYDHREQAGIVHIADHRISPGKKQWTWGNHEFGYAWDRNLTDPDEHGVHHPYIEIMAGVFTDNQPDFSFLAPGETRTFSQYWYPIREIGPAVYATLDAALGLQPTSRGWRVGVAVTRPLQGAKVLVRVGGKRIAEFDADLSPASPLVREVVLRKAVEKTALRIELLDRDGMVVFAHQPVETSLGEVPPPATEPPPPAEIASADELYLTGVHLEQYRHATRSPTDYWLEALARDPADCRCNAAMGVWHLERGEFALAVDRLHRAVASQTRRNPNPPDGSALYHLGLTLRHLGRDDDAYDAFYKATWNKPVAGAAWHAIAEIDCRRGDWARAVEHLRRSLRLDADNLRARWLLALVMRRHGDDRRAEALLRENLSLDPLDYASRHAAGDGIDADASVHLDVALDYAAAGFDREAIELLGSAPTEPNVGATPMLHYHRAALLQRSGQDKQAGAAWKRAREASADYCFPARLEDIGALEAAIAAEPTDARAPYYLGNLLYDRRRGEEAIAAWERSVKIDPAFAIPWRNLGIAYFNVRRKPAAARRAYEKAIEADPDNARLLFEFDQLLKRTASSVTQRIGRLERRRDLVMQRDDLAVELCSLYNQVGRHEDARAIVSTRRFQPWEGGEGGALGQHTRTHLGLAREAMTRGEPDEAVRLLEHALTAPENLGEARHLLANASDVHLALGEALSAAGDRDAARRHWTIAAEFKGDFQEMSVRPFSEMTHASALAMRALGRRREADRLLRDLLRYAEQLEHTPATIDYFATSLPTMLLFEDDLQARQRRSARVLQAQALAGLGEAGRARTLLADVLAEDPSDPVAADLLAAVPPVVAKRGRATKQARRRA
jgi:tetratricopeptide (TPR) repeat protein